MIVPHVCYLGVMESFYSGKKAAPSRTWCELDFCHFCHLFLKRTGSLGLRISWTNSVISVNKSSFSWHFSFVIFLLVFLYFVRNYSDWCMILCGPLKVFSMHGSQSPHFSESLISFDYHLTLLVPRYKKSFMHRW